MPITKWKLTIDLSHFWHNEDYTPAEQIEKAYAKIVDSDWMDITTRPFELEALIEELADVITEHNQYGMAEDDLVTEFDILWDAIYDLADVDRVWIKTF